MRTMTFLAIAVILLEGCHSYRALEIERRHRVGPVAPSGGDGKEDDVPRERRVFHRVMVPRYLVRMPCGSPIAAINNRAVELAEGGRYDGALILFREALAEGGGNAAVFNNLGVARELTGDRKGAFAMYAEACRREPGNRYFTYNFRTGADYRRGAGGD